MCCVRNLKPPQNEIILSLSGPQPGRHEIISDTTGFKLDPYGNFPVLSPPPAMSGAFYVDVVPYPGYGCRDALQAFVKPLPVPDTPHGPTEFSYCQ